MNKELGNLVILVMLTFTTVLVTLLAFAAIVCSIMQPTPKTIASAGFISVIATMGITLTIRQWKQ